MCAWFRFYTAMLEKIVFFLKLFILLRILEFVFGVVSLTVVPPLFLPDLDGEYNPLSVTEDILNVMVFWVFFVGFYVIFMGYILFSIIAFLIVEFTVGINKKNISYLNFLPYFLHSLPIMLGMLGGSVGIGLWIIWVLINIFNFFSPKLLKIFRGKLAE